MAVETGQSLEGYELEVKNTYMAFVLKLWKRFKMILTITQPKLKLSKYIN